MKIILIYGKMRCAGEQKLRYKTRFADKKLRCKTRFADKKRMSKSEVYFQKTKVHFMGAVP